jgi:hypothetical protein
MKTLFAASITAVALTPAITEWLGTFRRAVRRALATRAEVSAMMAEAYRRQR